MVEDSGTRKPPTSHAAGRQDGNGQAVTAGARIKSGAARAYAATREKAITPLTARTDRSATWCIIAIMILIGLFTK